MASAASDLDQPDLFPKRPGSVQTKRFISEINGIDTHFILIKYSNRIFIIVSEENKIGNLYRVQLESPQLNGIISNAPSVFDIKCILGFDSEEREVAVRALAEKLSLTTPLLLSLTITNLDIATITAISEVILNNRCW